VPAKAVGGLGFDMLKLQSVGITVKLSRRLMRASLWSGTAVGTK